MINHGLNGALNSERFGRNVRSVMPRFVQRLGIAGAEKLCMGFVRVLTPGFEEMNAPNHGTRCSQRKIRVVFHQGTAAREDRALVFNLQIRKIHQEIHAGLPRK